MTRAGHWPNLVELLRWNAEDRPGKTAYVMLADGKDGRISIDYNRLDVRARAIGARLAAAGAVGHPVLICYPTGLDFVCAFFGCLPGGAAAARPPPPRGRRQEGRLRSMIMDSGVRFVLTASDHVPAIERHVAGLGREDFTHVIDCGTIGDELASAWTPIEVDADSLALLQYSSGSTAAPKGVMVTHGNLLHNQEAIKRAFGHDEDTIVLGWLPLFHDMGLIGNVLQSLYVGAPCFLMTPAAFLHRPIQWLRAISTLRVTTSGAPDFAYTMCVHNIAPEEREGLDLSCWRVAFNGSEPVRAETIERFTATYAPHGFRAESFFPCYGLAEATLFVSGGSHTDAPIVRHFERIPLERNEVTRSSRPAEGAVALVGCGRPWLDTRIAIVDPESSSSRRPGEIGEVCVRGPAVALGYWKAADDTERTFRTCLADPESGPFLRTGDLGFIDGDELFVTGRIKDLIIIRGRNIYPHDIEATVVGCHPALRPDGCVVFSIEAPDGEQLVIVQEVDTKRPNADLDEIIAAIRIVVTDKHDLNVDHVYLTKAGVVPKTTSGKIQRQACRSMLIESRLPLIAQYRMPLGRSVEPRAIGSPERSRREVLALDPIGRRRYFEEFVQDRMANMLGVSVSHVDLQKSSAAMGLDSLKAMRLQNAVESHLGIELPVSAILGGSALYQLVAHALDAVDNLVMDKKPVESLGTRPPSLAIDAPFPLNDLQQAYWAGRNHEYELGNVAAHVYLEFESTDCDFGRLERAWQRLVDRHDALRTVVRSDARQQVLERVPSYQIEVTDLRLYEPGAIEQQVEIVRHRMSHQMLALGRWPLFEIRAQRIDDRRSRIHFSIDLFISDASSLRLLMNEWQLLYHDLASPLPPLGLSFRDYVLAEEAARDTTEHRRSLAYWRERAALLPPPPQLPHAKDPATIARPRFVRRSQELPPELWRELKARAAGYGLTASGIILAAYAEVLAAWSESPKFTLNVTHFDRRLIHEQVERLVGQFASFSLLAVDGSGASSFAVRARGLQENLMEALDHRSVSGVEVLREMARGGRTGPGPSAPIVFTSVLQDLAETRWLGELTYSISQTPQVLLDHQLFERDGALVLVWDVVDAAFPEGLIDAMFSAYGRFLRRLCDEEAAWIEAPADLVPIEQLEQRASINSTDSPIVDELLQTLVAKQVVLRPDQAAIVCGPKMITYKELFAMSARLGRRLREFGVQVNTPVAIVMEKGWEQIVAALGIIQAGAAYLPIDPHLPRDRLHDLLRNSGSQIVLTQPRLRQEPVWPDEIHLVCVDDEVDTAIDDAPLQPAQSPDDIAYILYTSGSTGTPKGVMITHRSVINALQWTNRQFCVGANDRVLALTALHHDMSVYDVFGLLAAGGTIVLPESRLARDPAHWASLLDEQNITIWNSVPSTMTMLVEYLEGRPNPAATTMRLVFLGGDWIPLTLPGRVRSLFPQTRTVSVGGPTETTLWNIWYPIDTLDPSWKSVPYGKPIDNTKYHVLNERLEPCPVWLPGRLYCSGIGLAKGYWRDEQATESSFIVHPRSRERLYRSGDLGRYLPDGNIEILGRLDFQVKIHGHRVELGEIEATLQRHHAVRAAVVRLLGEPHGRRRLVAYLVCDKELAPSDEELRSFLGEKVAPYMVPSSFMFLDALPLTNNGKVDRTALPSPNGNHVSAQGKLSVSTTRALPVTVSELTQRITGIVAGILDVVSLSPDTEFRSLGATSVDLIRLATALEKEFGYRPSIDRFVSFSRVDLLANFYEQAVPHAPQQSLSSSSVDPQGPCSQDRSSPLLIDPSDRERFRRSEPGLRQFDSHAAVIPLAENQRTRDAGFHPRKTRGSHRRFSSDLILLPQLSELLSCLRPHEGIGGRLKYPYASGGGLYAVQVYLHVRPRRVDQLPGGTYYYHPKYHHLVLVSGESNIPSGIHWPSNRIIFDEAAFSLFLIAQLNAIIPMYGGESLRFATLEAGSMSHLLESTGGDCQIGLCQIGHVDFGAIRHLFALDDGHVLVHSMVGGLAINGDSGALQTHDGALTLGCSASRGDHQYGPPDDRDVGAPAAGLTSRDHCLAVNVSDLAVEAAEIFRIAIPPAHVVHRPGASGVLLTGATGFLGAFMLREIHEQTDAILFCLARAGDAEEAGERIRNNLKRYGLWREEMHSRIVPIAGDLSIPRFGLPVEDFEHLADQVHSIYHVGAWVNWVQPYRAFRPMNVCGTHEIIRLASVRGPKHLHYVSTLAVFPFSGRTFGEDSPLDHQESLYGGYAQSKWVAEKLVDMACSLGLPATVYRPAIISGHSETGVFNETAYFESMIKGCIQLGAAPEFDTRVDVVPVDYVSRAIVRLSLREDFARRTFHLANARPISMAGLIDWIRSFGYALRPLSFDAWRTELIAHSAFENNAMHPFSIFLADLKEEYAQMPEQTCDYTLAALGDSLVCPPVDDPLLRTYFSRFLEQGFLRPPGE
jgi:amino acid adenylation domain-containing protein/thioester reductase-like protein